MSLRRVLPGLLVAASLAAAACGDPASPADAWSCSDCSLVLISIDTLRADHLGCYGYERDTSPALDRFAGQSVRFERAYGASYHTADSHMSMFTALRPSVHGVRNANDAAKASSLPTTIDTLPERLAAAGFTTLGFHGGGNVSGPYGFARGFSSYRPTLNDLRPAAEWLDRRRQDGGGRFFLFVHTYRPHDPYLPDPPFDSMWLPDYRGTVISDATSLSRQLEDPGSFQSRRDLFWSRVDESKPEDLAKLVALYDGEIRQTDGEIGELLDRIDALEERILVVVLSDHGEEFFEHGKNLHDQVYEESLRVPFLIRHPDRIGAGSVIADRVSLVDLAPTLLDLLSLPRLELAQGVSLSTLLDRAPGPAGAEQVILAEKVVGDPQPGSYLPFLKQALVVGDWKLIRQPGTPPKLFDLARDEGEKTDLARSEQERLKGLDESLQRINRANARLAIRYTAGGRPKAALGDEEVESLRALGYLQ